FESGSLDEERRIAYVGVTRAKERLYLTYANQRLLYGSVKYSEPSRFIKEMMEPKKVMVSKRIEPSTQNTTFLKAGDKVNHQVFGEGIVVNVEDDIATIAFKMPHGVKKILENHPSLRKI